MYCFGACCLLFVACCSLSVVCCSLFDGSRLSFVVWCLVFVGVFFVVWRLLRVV